VKLISNCLEFVCTEFPTIQFPGIDLNSLNVLTEVCDEASSCSITVLQNVEYYTE